MYLNQPKGFVNGIKQGSKCLICSAKSGIVGLVQKPIEGIREEGGIGFFKGSMKGLMGLIVKPVTGFMDATSMTIQGIRSASSYSLSNSDDYKGL
jgi:vacuolar protein sorting-associated protein 13A/C